MHICHVITRLIIGGAQENTVLSCKGLVARGHEVTLAAGPETGPEGSLWADAADTGARVVKLDHMRRAVRPWTDLRAARELCHLLRALKPDVVHTHSSKAGILGRWAAARAGVPVVVHTIHGMSFNRTQPAPVRWLYGGLERWAARRTTMFVSVADAMTRQAVAAGLAPADRFVTIRSGIDVSRFEPSEDTRRRTRAGWGVADEAVVIGTVARLFENKGYDEIMAAMPRIVAAAPQARFVWIGDGANRQTYERRLESMGLRGRVTLAGLVSPARVAELIHGFDVLLHASRWEGLPRAVVQGLLAGVPAVSFDIDGAAEVVAPGETGLLAPLGDVNALANAVIELAGDPARRRRLGLAGRARCLHEFDGRTMVDRLDALYTRLTR